MKNILVLLTCVCYSFFVKAQWTTGTNIYNTNSGNVGIGTTNPQNKLQIGPNPSGFGGNDLVISSGTSNVELAISNAATYSTLYGNSDVAIQSGYGKWALYAKADGNVGIGTTSPDNLFQVHSSNIPTIAIGKGNQNTNGKSSLLFNAGDGTAFNGFWINYFKTTSIDRLGFVDGGGIERLAILNGGNVGIGTTSPNQKLAVAGNQSVTGDVWIGTDGGGVSTLSGPAFSGAIQIKTHSGLGGAANRYLRLGVKDNNLVFYPVLSINDDQNVGIGTTIPDAKLAVKGQVHAQEVKVDLNGAVAPDYVFEKDYKLTSLEEIKNYIDQNKHLPEVPSAKEMEKNGVQLGEMNMLLLKKIEELTLYVIELKRENQMQNDKINSLTKMINK